MYPLKLEEVFKLSGFPQHTFVKPLEYEKLLVSLRTPGRGLIIEGPSGIGKTTSVTKALDELGSAYRATKLNARKQDDRKIIVALPEMRDNGIVIIDDFHRLDEHTRELIADYMKTLADEENPYNKIVLVGINRTGQSLVRFGNDLGSRIDVIRFESNPENRLLELIAKGEHALAVWIRNREEIAREAQGCFQLAQMLCHETCLLAGITERRNTALTVTVSLEIVRDRVFEQLSEQFLNIACKFARGPRFRRAGRAPYLHLLNWLATAGDWSLELDHALAFHRNQREAVGRLIERRLLERFLEQDPEFGAVFHYHPQSRVFCVEDPKFMYFLRNLVWSKFAKQVGFARTEFPCRYDFALSFAGPDRPVAEAIADRLARAEVAVFYDKNEQHRILAENVEDYLGPIYRTDAQFVLALLSPEYPKRIWTKFESDQFKARFGDHNVIPVRFNDAPVEMFGPSAPVGGLFVDRREPLEPQIRYIVSNLIRKLEEARGGAAKACPISGTAGGALAQAVA
jgi:hypothetical protein